MTDVDTSIYNSQQTSGNSPLNMLSQVAGVQNQLNQAKMFQQEYQSKLAVSKLYNSAPLDANGDPDQSWILKNAGQAGIMAPEVTHQAYQVQAAQQAVEGQKLQNAKTRSSIAGAALMPLANNPDASASDFIDATNDLVHKGYFTPEEQHQVILGLASHLKNGTVQTYAKGIVGKTLAAGGNIEYGQKYLAGEPATIQTNTGIQPGMRDITSGAFKPAGAQIPLGLPPTTPVYQGGSARPTYAGSQPSNPFQNVASAQGQPGSAQPQSQGAAPPGGLPPTATPSKTPTPATDTNTYASAPPAFEGQLHPAQARVNDVIERGNNAVKIIPSLQGVLRYADSGGPNQELQNKFIGAIKDTPLGKMFDADTTPQARFEILNKYASDVSGQNMSANARNELESGVQALSNPNAKQFPMALRTVAKFLLGRTAGAKAQADFMTPLAKDPNVTPEKILDAEKEWRENYNQDVFELPYMTPDEKKNLAASMGKPDSSQSKKFEKQLRWTVQQGLLDPGDL
jgi:hypothetical protein